MSKKILTSGLILSALMGYADTRAKDKMSVIVDMFHMFGSIKHYDLDMDYYTKTKNLDGEDESLKAAFNLFRDSNGMGYGAETGIRTAFSYGKEFGGITISAQLGLGTELYSKAAKLDKFVIKSLAKKDEENVMTFDEKSKTLSDSDKKLSFKFTNKEDKVSLKTNDDKTVVDLDLEDGQYSGTWDQTPAAYATEKSANLTNIQKAADYLFTQWVKQSITPTTADDATKKKINELSDMSTPALFGGQTSGASAGFQWNGSTAPAMTLSNLVTGATTFPVANILNSGTILGSLIKFVATSAIGELLAGLGGTVGDKSITLVEGDLAKEGKLTAAGFAKLFSALGGVLESGDTTFNRTNTAGAAMDLTKSFFAVGQQLKVKGEGAVALDAAMVKALTGKDAEATKSYFLMLVKDANGNYTAQIMTGDTKMFKAFGQELKAEHLDAKVHQATHNVESMVELSALKKRKLISVDLSAVFEKKVAKKVSLLGGLGGAYAYNSTTADFVIKTTSEATHKATADIVVGEAVTFASLLESTRDLSIDEEELEEAMENADDAEALEASATDAAGAKDSKESVKLRNHSVGMRAEIGAKYHVNDTFAIKAGIIGAWMYQLEMKQKESKDSDGKTKAQLFKIAQKAYTKKNELDLGFAFGVEMAF